MKSLRQLLRRASRSHSSERSSKRRADKRQRLATQRRLSSQALEQRQLLAGDLAVAHNYWNSFDVNQDQQITPSDALRVINYLGQNSEGELSGDFEGNKVDVNADGQVTPIDALNVVNALGRGEQMNPLVEYFLTARDLNDDPLPVDNGIVQVDVDQSFFLEVSYNDLRTFGNDIGAFTVVTDLGVSQGGVLRPVLRETQRAVIGEEILTASSGDIVFSLEGTSQTITVPLGDFGSSPTTEISNVLQQFGYDTSEFEITQFEIGSGDDLGYQIRYIAPEFGNVDLPNLGIMMNLDVTVPVTLEEQSPFAKTTDDGTGTLILDGNNEPIPNSGAVRFNINSLSRTFNDNDPFYENLNRGAYTLADGFDDVGGVGGVPGSGGGIRGLSDDGSFPEPFDAFSLEVFISEPLSSPLIVDVNPGESVDALTLYGEDDEVTEDLITIGPGARVTLSTGAPQNNAPDLGTSPLTRTYTEEDSDATLDLLFDATDLDGDTLSVADVDVTGNLAGISFDGQIVSISPMAYDSLAAGESAVISYTYNVTDGIANVAQSATITITGVNDSPVLGTSPLVAPPLTEDDNNTTFDLLTDVSDVDTNDTLSVVNVSTSGDLAGISLNGSVVSIMPMAYNALPVGSSEVITYTYEVTDGTVNLSQSATITIEGVNDDPTVGAEVTATANIAVAPSGTTNVNLLTGASDPDTGDVVDVTSVSLDSGDGSGITFDDVNNQLVVDHSAYSLADDATIDVVYSYDVVDGNGGTVQQVATVTISNVQDDPPEISGPVIASFLEDDNDGTVSLIANATDPEGQPLSVVGLQLDSGDATGITPSGTDLLVSPITYNSLPQGTNEVVSYTYQVSDGVNNVNQSATVTIQGVNDAPTVAAALVKSVTEDDNSTDFDLLEGASDVDQGDTLSITTPVLQNGGDDSGVSINGSTLTVDPSAYNDLAQGESVSLVYTYSVQDNNQGSVSQSATITITGVNDEPTVGGALSDTTNEDASNPFSINLLDGAADADANDVLSVADLNVNGLTNFNLASDGTFSFDPNDFNSLSQGGQATISLTYNVTDGIASVAQSATIDVDGINDAPMVAGPISESFDEDFDGTATVSLLQGASDPDTNDTLSVTDVTLSGDDPSGITRNGATLTIDPSFYGDMLDLGQSVTINYSYNVSDGIASVAQTASITIDGRDDDPVVSGPISVSFLEFDDPDTVDLLAGASDPNGDALSVVNATLTGDVDGVVLNGNGLDVTPQAYQSLDDGETATATLTYQISDPFGNTVDQTATVTIIGQDLQPSTISGQLFIDKIENRHEVADGGDPIRNGIKEDDEPGLGGVEVRLLMSTGSGETVVETTFTDAHGNYTLNDQYQPGTYMVEYHLPDSVVYIGSNHSSFVIPDLGGADIAGPMLNAIGLSGPFYHLELLADYYAGADIHDTNDFDGVVPGVSVQLDSSGNQLMYIAQGGFENMMFAEVTVNAAQDAALLSVVDSNGMVHTAQVSKDQFLMTADGTGIRVLGEMSEFDFSESTDELVQSEFEDYRDAVDAYLATLE